MVETVSDPVAEVAIDAHLSPTSCELTSGFVSIPVASSGGGGSTKELRLDKAYFKWNAADDLYLQAGKFSNPLYRPAKSSLLWDGDWRPEGISAGWSGDLLFANFLGNWLESDSRRDNDTFAWGLQGGVMFSLGDARLTTALAYYDFPTAGRSPFYGDDDEPEFFGNSSTADGLSYLYDYDTGWLAGVTLGKASDRGDWALGYQYRDLEADAVLGLLSDSDFSGGGTDGKGHILSAAYGINKQWSLGLTWLLDNEAGEKNLADQGGALSYDRIQLDTKFKY